MGPKKISVIVPYVREWPQIAFTIRSIHESLIGVDHEVLAIDNLMPTMQEDRGSENVRSMAKLWADKGDPWLKYFHYKKKLSHWQCKNFAMSKAEGDIYWFVDSHCIVPASAVEAILLYRSGYKSLEGSLHMPLTYHILEPKQLMYKTKVNTSNALYHYKFHTFYPSRYLGAFTEVPAMSTCGMIIHKDYMELLGGWPKELGIYGGGENFINFTMAVLGLKKYVWVGDSLCHHGEKRGYSWNHYDYQRNRSIATYMFGGKRLLEIWLKKEAKFSRTEIRKVYRNICLTLRGHRNRIKDNQKYEIEEWVQSWKDSDLLIGE